MSAAHISITARLARDPEVRTSAKGTSVVTLTLPVDVGWGDNKQTTWWNAVLFGKRADAAAQHLQKGSWVCVSGTAGVRTYDKKDGSKGFAAEVTVNDWAFVGPKQQASAPADNNVGPRSAPAMGSMPYSDADLPF